MAMRAAELRMPTTPVAASPENTQEQQASWHFAKGTHSLQNGGKMPSLLNIARKARSTGLPNDLQVLNDATMGLNQFAQA